LFRTGNFSEDFGGGLGPDVGLGLIVVCVEIVDDSLLQFIDALEDAAADALSGDLGKEALDHVEPRTGSRREVQVKARMPLEPALYRGSLVGGIIVDDEMQIEIGRCPFVDGVEEAEEFAMPVGGMHSPMTVPSSMLSAANRVVVPLRL